MNFGALPEPPPQSKIIKRFVEVFLFGRIRIANQGKLYLTQYLAVYLDENPFDSMKKDCNQDQLMLHFEKSVTLFLEISSVQERKELMEWYKFHPCKVIINQLIKIQRKNYSFQYRHFPLDLNDEIIEHTLVQMEIMPIQIFTMLVNQLARISWYIKPTEGYLTENAYENIFTWLLSYYNPSVGLLHSRDTLLSYVPNKAGDFEPIINKDEISSYNDRMTEIICEDFDNYQPSQLLIN